MILGLVRMAASSYPQNKSGSEMRRKKKKKKEGK
ncbi:hypothetical protein QG37_08149 [Candidozyma auris]|nr:hypothetical protein QG37_08149 [[Candida] auris]